VVEVIIFPAEEKCLTCFNTTLISIN